MATKVPITDTKLGINEAERRLKINRAKLDLFTRLKEALSGDPGILFERLAGIKEMFFQGRDLTIDEILLVRNEVFADFVRFEHWFRDVTRSVSGPTLPERAKPSKRLVAGMTSISGLFFFILLAFFLEFIRRSRGREKIEDEAVDAK